MNTETTSDLNSSQTKSPESEQNVRFYKNEIPAYPNKECIDEILKWYGNYDELEYNHSYIQWIFPNREMGMNSLACVLTDKEAEIIRTSEDLRGKVKAAFEMMLDFYGMRLTKNNEFKLAENSEERLAELNKRYNHNFLRITRILLALKELGHNELALPWMKFLADLIYKENILNCAQSSFENYWINALDADDKLQLIDYQNTLLRNSNASKSLRNTTASPREDSSDISTNSKERPISSSFDKVSPVITNSNDDIENFTSSSFTNINESTFTISTASDTSKDTEAIATEVVDAKFTSTNIPDTVPKSTPTKSTDAMASSQVSDASKHAEAIVTEDGVAKSISSNIPDMVSKSTPTISTDAMASSQVSDASKHAEAIVTEDVVKKSSLNTTSTETAVPKHTSNLKKSFNQFC